MYGAYEPTAGHRFNPNKLLLDPYAKAIGRLARWTDQSHGYIVGDPQADLSFSPVDNAAYYRLSPADRRYYIDYTGCGNTLNVRNPRVLQFIMDSLRYWVTQMHVDGFRFDLASTLARELHEVDKLGAFFDIIHQDPILSQVKLIAEPWDLGEGGYQVGNFPVGWSEWNGRFRDCVRRFWKGDGGLASEFATRISGSSDLYQWNGRRPHASINFVTCHDGFTLNDLVSYDHKHNEANLEDNRDGTDQNDSWNCGVEGPTDDAAIQQLRAKKRRAILATLLLSQGVPMLLSGDEVGHSQQGNNNAYCQDNELTWLDWDWDEQSIELLEFVKRLIELRKSQPVLQRRRFFHGRAIRGVDSPEITWLDPNGREMSEASWNNPIVRCLGVHYRGGKIDVDEYGETIIGDHVLILFNADHGNPIHFELPDVATGNPWQRVFDSSSPNENGTDILQSSYTISPCSVVALRSLVEESDLAAAAIDKELINESNPQSSS